MTQAWIDRNNQDWTDRTGQTWIDRPLIASSGRYNSLDLDPIGNVYEGDPLLQLTVDGFDITFTNGQPQMDEGLFNFALLKLFVDDAWIGNTVLDTAIGSNFTRNNNQPVTLSFLNDLRIRAENAFADDRIKNADVTVTNPTSYQIDVEIRLTAPTDNANILILTRNNSNWVAQKNYGT